MTKGLTGAGLNAILSLIHISRNEYETFNVPEKGAILNNSYTLSKSELAGYVQGNNNMAERPAKIIGNEVTGTGSTSMDGFLEVAGNRADVVIANPNGIRCV